MEKTKLEYLPLETLKAYERNTRTHSDEQIEQLKNSITEFGFTNPILIDENNVIIAGHGRSVAARSIGLNEVPCIRLKGLTETQRKALRIADNQLALNAGWDEELLRIELEEIKAEDFNLDLIGFSLDELETLLKEPEDEKVVEEDNAPEIAPERCHKGDIWQLGNHRLMCGDSTDEKCVEMLMGGERADIAFTSPPYGAADSSKLREKYVHGKRKLKSFYDEHDDDKRGWKHLFLCSLNNMMKHSFTQFVNVQMLADNKVDLISVVNDFSERLVDIIIWDKHHAAPQMHSNILNNRFEFIFIFDNENNSRTIRYGNFHGNEQNLIEVVLEQNKYADVHKAVFPVALPAEILRINSKAKSCLDLFGGTGTTLIACEQIGKKCFMMELSDKYCDIIIQRWENLTGQKAVKL